MAQGKLKVKAKLPDSVKVTKKKGRAFTRRSNAPSKSTKQKLQAVHKLKQAITKTVNKAMEDEMRTRAVKSDNKNLSKAQEAVAKYHKEMVPKDNK